MAISRVKSRLPVIAAEITPRVTVAIKDVADAIADDAKQRVPVETGDLRDAIHVEFKGAADWAVVAGNSKAFYGHMVEHGTTRAAPRPFLIPAAEAKKEMIDEVVGAALRRL